MRVGGIGIALLAVALLQQIAHAQYQPPSQSLLINAGRAATWQQDQTSVIELLGPVTVDLDRTHLSADNAIVWLTPSPGGQPDEQTATIALIGHAVLEQAEVKRSGDRLLVNAEVSGTIRLTAAQRIAADDSNSMLYQEALTLRSGGPASIAPSPAATQPTTSPSTRPVHVGAPILFHGSFQSITTSNGKLALLFSNGVTLSRADRNGGVLDMQADRAVLFTPLTNIKEVQGLGQITAIQQAITAAYLEGDVRISHSGNGPEQRLEASRVYYEFTTDRAYLTNAVIRTRDPKANIPIIVRAQVVRQLSENEYSTKNAELTTSSFAVPSYSMRADKAYIRDIDTGDPRYGQLTQFKADDVTLRAYNVPFFYFPELGGEFTQRGMALRGLETESSKIYGFGVRTDWGLLEALGYVPSPDLDMDLRLDYFQDRGPGAGLNVDYGGGFITETTRQAWNFQGTLDSYFLFNDNGTDDLGHHRLDEPPEQSFRGRIRWQHQQFLPGDWQVQLQSGWVSDPNFLEEFFHSEFNDAPPLETSFYAKKQKDSEAFTFLLSLQPNHIVTTADMYQEVREFGPRIGDFPDTTNDHPFEIERIPELGYHRIGDSLLDDNLTFFSDNTFSGNQFMTGKASLAELGFREPNPSKGRIAVLPGIPALGTTGTTSNTVYRGDSRQELDWPFSLGQFRLMPYVAGRYTGYSDSPDQAALNRFLAASGIRINTAFWKIDDDVNSDLLDIHRVRHVIEPEVDLFTSAANADRQDVYIYDSNVDAINDVSAANVGLLQRWQTKRGGPGNECSVDFFTLNVGATWYANKPPASVIPPNDFRGLFFPTEPEASIPRDFVNGEALLRVTDSTAILSDAQWNMDQQNLATASIGLAVRRGERVGYFIGTRYIEDLNSAITTVAFQYELSAKYTLIARESFDFGQNHDVYQSISLQRRFDRFFMLISIYSDEANNNSGISFALYPEGLGRGLSTSALENVFGRPQ